MLYGLATVNQKHSENNLNKQFKLVLLQDILAK